MHSSLQFQIEQLRHDKIVYALESIAVLVFSFFMAVFLPQLLVRYLYADQQLFQEPMLLQYIPVVAFAVGTGFFVFAAVGNIMRYFKIRKLEAMLDEDDCCGCGCGSCDMPDEMLMKAASMASTTTKTAASTRKSSTKKSK
jgi:hypothetical protein